MKQFFKHFGSKARLASLLPPPRFPLIIEPFAGSAAYSVAHATPRHKVMLFDTDERVCTVWRYLIGATEEQIMELPVDHFLKGGDIRDLNLPRAEYLLIQRWLSISGTHAHYLAPCLIADRNGQAGNVWDHNTRRRISRQVELIKHWEVYQLPYDASPDVEAHWHVDPPYQGNLNGFSEYKCEPPDYEKLADWCRSRRGDITVHEQAGATWLPFVTLKANHSTSRVTAGEMKRAHEVYWTNEARGRDGSLMFDFGAAV